MSTEWDEPPVLAAPETCHPDPTPGGPPRPSADGHWWWDGRAWVPAPHPSTTAV